MIATSDATFRRLKPDPYDVAIVGCGPTGAALANLLGQRGLSVLVVDRNPGVLQIPRAVHIDGETMRVFQSMKLASEMLGIMRPGHGMHWVDSAGDVLLVRKGIEGLGPQGWHNDYYFHQPELERVLREGMARFEDVTLFEGVVVTRIEEDGADVGRGSDGAGSNENGDHDADADIPLIGLTLSNLDNGATASAACRYLVGCDGARSMVRAHIGSAQEDLGQHQAWLVVDGVLDHPLPLPEHSVQHCDPARPATSIYVHPLRRRWEIMLLPSDDPEAITQPEVVWSLLARWVKPSQATLERAATYMFHSLVAGTWQRGRIVIAGDAAHQTPPFLGQGLCAGIRDAANLAWKLALVSTRAPAPARASPLAERPERSFGPGDASTLPGPKTMARKAALLATYGPERRPHAREFVKLAVDMGDIIQVTDRQEAAARDQRLKAEGLQFPFPSPTLGRGVHRARPDGEDAIEAIGKIFPQPMLPSGLWLDDHAAGRFCLLLKAGEDANAWLDADHRRILDALNVVIIEGAGPEADAWLSSRRLGAVVLRPDAYVFDACATAPALHAAIDELRDWLP